MKEVQEASHASSAFASTGFIDVDSDSIQSFQELPVSITWVPYLKDFSKPARAQEGQKKRGKGKKRSGPSSLYFEYADELDDCDEFGNIVKQKQTKFCAHLVISGLDTDSSYTVQSFIDTVFLKPDKYELLNTGLDLSFISQSTVTKDPNHIPHKLYLPVPVSFREQFMSKTQAIYLDVLYRAIGSLDIVTLRSIGRASPPNRGNSRGNSRGGSEGSRNSSVYNNGSKTSSPTPTPVPTIDFTRYDLGFGTKHLLTGILEFKTGPVLPAQPLISRHVQVKFEPSSVSIAESIALLVAEDKEMVEKKGRGRNEKNCPRSLNALDNQIEKRYPRKKPTDNEYSGKSSYALRVKWSLDTYSGGLPIDEIQVFRRVQLVKNTNAVSARLESQLCATEGESPPTTAFSILASTKWCLVKSVSGRTSGYTDMLPVRFLHHLLQTLSLQAAKTPAVVSADNHISMVEVEMCARDESEAQSVEPDPGPGRLNAVNSSYESFVEGGSEHELLALELLPKKQELERREESSASASAWPPSSTSSSSRATATDFQILYRVRFRNVCGWSPASSLVSTSSFDSHDLSRVDHYHHQSTLFDRATTATTAAEIPLRSFLKDVRDVGSDRSLGGTHSEGSEYYFPWTLSLPSDQHTYPNCDNQTLDDSTRSFTSHESRGSSRAISRAGEYADMLGVPPPRDEITETTEYDPKSYRNTFIELFNKNPDESLGMMNEEMELDTDDLRNTLGNNSQLLSEQAPVNERVESSLVQRPLGWTYDEDTYLSTMDTECEDCYDDADDTSRICDNSRISNGSQVVDMTVEDGAVQLGCEQQEESSNSQIQESTGKLLSIAELLARLSFASPMNNQFVNR